MSPDVNYHTAVRKKIWVSVAVLIIIASILLLLFNYPRSTTISTILPEIFQKQNQVSPGPSPFPFQEITIPYLRGRTYSSRLGQLAKLSENQNYTSYLTNYDSDGLKINGLLTQPIGVVPANGWPAVVFVHGYIAPSAYQTTERYIAHVNYLASNGFVVFKIDLRGHGISEGEAGGAYFSSDYIIDTLNSRAALVSSGFVNPRQIGLWGHSMAGNVVLRSFATQPGIPAVVIWAGAVYSYTDRLEFGIYDNSYHPPVNMKEQQRKRQQLRDTYGEFSADSQFWKQVAPTNYLSDLQGAIQIHHAVDDTVVSIGYSRNLMKLLESTNVAHELFEYPSGGHNLDGSSFSLAMQRTVEFFKKNFGEK